MNPIYLESNDRPANDDMKQCLNDCRHRRAANQPSSWAKPANAAGPGSWDDGDDASPSLPAGDDGRGISQSVASADVEAISGRLLEVMARNGHAPRIFAGAND